MKITLPAKRENWPALSSRCEEYLGRSGCNDRQIITILIAIEEIFINIASYAYGRNEGPATIELVCSQPDEKNAQIAVRVEDTGKPFDPVSYIENKDMAKQAESHVPGGMGIHLVKSSMDGICYQRQDGKNVLTFHKTFYNTEKPEERAL